MRLPRQLDLLLLHIAARAVRRLERMRVRLHDLHVPLRRKRARDLVVHQLVAVERRRRRLLRVDGIAQMLLHLRRLLLHALLRVRQLVLALRAAPVLEEIEPVHARRVLRRIRRLRRRRLRCERNPRRRQRRAEAERTLFLKEKRFHLSKAPVSFWIRSFHFITSATRLQLEGTTAAVVSGGAFWYNEDMEKKHILYHGTTKAAKASILKNGIQLDVNNGNQDFGPGFYLTPNKGLAKARRKINPAILAYTIDTTGLRIKFYHGMTDAWKEEIFEQRVYGNDVSTNFDCVIGPMADGAVRQFASAVRRGKVSKEQFFDEIYNPNWNSRIQFVIKSREAANRLIRELGEEQ